MLQTWCKWRTRPASFHCVVPPMPTGVSEMLGLFLSVGEAGPKRPATFTPLEGITCREQRLYGPARKSN